MSGALAMFRKWGIFKENFDTAIKVGKPAARAIDKLKPDYVVSECPLAGPHLKQVLKAVDLDVTRNGSVTPSR